MRKSVGQRIPEKEIANFKFAELTQKSSKELFSFFIIVSLWYNRDIRILICKDMDKVEAQYALESTSQPLGISSYELSKLIPEEFRGSMPTIEEIEAELNE